MALRTSLIIAGDASSAVQAADQTGKALDATSAQAAKLGKAYQAADVAITRLAAAQVSAKRETDQAKAAYVAGEIELKDYNARLLETKSALSLVEAEHRKAVGELKKLGAASTATGQESVQGSRAAQAGYVNFGRQVQDVAVMLQSGANIGTIVALQGGQVADAVSQMGGRFAGLGRLMAGPLGTAIIVLSSSLLNMAQAHWEAAGAANDNAIAMKQVELASSGLSDAQSVLGEMFDLTTGKIKEQNELLRLNAQLQALNLRVEADAARAAANKASEGIGISLGRSAAIGYLGAGAAYSNAGTELQQKSEAARDRVRSTLDKVIAGTLDADQALKAVSGDDLKGLNIELKAYREALVKAVEARFKGQTADAITEALEKGRLPESLRKPDTSTKSTVDQIAERAEDAAKKIANIKDQFSDLPSAVEKANKAMRELQDISSDIERSKVPAAQKSRLKDAIEEAGKAVEASLNRPFDDYLEKSREGVRLADLLAAGRDEEAEALKIVLSLKDKMRPLDQAQLDIILATVRAEEQRSLALRDQRALIQANVAEVHNMREALERTVADAFRGRFSIDRVLAQLGNSYINLTAQRFVEKMFGDTLRSIEEQARRGGPLEAATTMMADALGEGSDAVASFAEAVDEAARRITGTPAPAANDNAGAANDNGDTFVVTGRRLPKLAGSDPGTLLVGLTDGLLRDIGIKLPSIVGDSLEKGLSKLDKLLPSLLGGAIAGASTSRIILGDRGTGGTIGSAAGGALGQKFGEKFLEKGLSSISSGLGSFAGPLGSIAGGLIGGLIGGIFKKRDSGSSGAITGVDQPASVSGSNAQVQSEISALSGNVQTSIAQIAKQLNASVGAFSVAIGKYGDYYRVSASGTQDPSAKYFSRRNTNPDSLYDGPDANVALSLAIQNAISDGAVQGISPKVAAALKSSKNIDAALAEALKVQDLELSIGGVSAQLEKAYKDFEQAAKDRLRIARSYGFDMVKVEELNAKQRLALTEKLVADQVGSLQSLLDEITGGALFEGSAVDKRAAIFAQIDKVKADADAGVEGAADRLAQLIEQGLAASKEVNATTGGYAADRQLLVDAARDTITRANQRVNEAQKTSDPALAQTNSLLDEGNDQSARIITQLASIDNWLQQLNAGGGAANSYDGLRNVVAFK